jgi:hypothetical protein
MEEKKPTTVDPRTLYTTPKQRKEFEVLYDENRVWVRKNSKDKTLHRVGNVHPQHFGAQQADELTNQINPTTGEQIEAFWCIDIATIYRFKEQKVELNVGGERKSLNQKFTLSDFRMPCWKFLEEFEQSSD